MAAAVLVAAGRPHLLDLSAPAISLSLLWRDNANMLPVTLSAVRLGCRVNFKWVIRDMSFSLSPGSALLLQGPNGSGKTTLLRAVASFSTPLEGAFFVNGQYHTAWEYHEAIKDHAHYVGARVDGLTESLGVEEQLRMLCHISGGSEKLLNEAFSRMQVDHLRDRDVRQLSTGQRRMLSFVRLLAAPRTVWLLDEPTIALDTKYVAHLPCGMC